METLIYFSIVFPLSWKHTHISPIRFHFCQYCESSSQCHHWQHSVNKISTYIHKFGVWPSIWMRSSSCSGRFKLIYPLTTTDSLHYERFIELSPVDTKQTALFQKESETKWNKRFSYNCIFPSKVEISILLLLSCALFYVRLQSSPMACSARAQNV